MDVLKSKLTLSIDSELIKKMKHKVINEGINISGVTAQLYEAYLINPAIVSIPDSRKELETTRREERRRALHSIQGMLAGLDVDVDEIRAQRRAEKYENFD
jgi:hypothetical protein